MGRIVAIVLALIVIVGAAMFVLGRGEDETPTATTSPTTSTINDTESITADTGTQDDANVLSGEVEVEIEDRAYMPANITVKKGTTVTWTNKDDMEHDVAADEGAFDSELLAKDETFEFTFDTVGTFDYHCTPHPDMIGTVTVVE